MVVTMINFKNVMSLSLALSILLSVSQAHAGKRSWQDLLEEENLEAASAQALEPQFFTLEEYGDETSENLEEMHSHPSQGTIPNFLIPGYSEWLASADYETLLLEQEVLDASLKWGVLCSKQFNTETPSNAAQAQAASQPLQHEDPAILEDRDPIDALVEEYLKRELDPNLRLSLWPIMDPAEITEDSEKVDGSTLTLPKTEPEIAPGDSSAYASPQSPSVDFTDKMKSGSETDSDKENYTLSQPKNGRRAPPSILEACTQFVETYKKFSTTLTGGILNKAVMTELGLNRSAFTMLLDKARYDYPEAFKEAKRVRR